MEKQKVAPIKTLLDALQVRKIRNECKSFMTNNTADIGLSQQIFWYYFKYQIHMRDGIMTCYLLSVDKRKCGYGLIRKFSGKYWITGGLKKSERGKGLGRVLFEYLIKNTPSTQVWLEVKESNSKAIKLYKSLGFKKIKVENTRDGVFFMRREKFEKP